MQDTLLRDSIRIYGVEKIVFIASMLRRDTRQVFERWLELKALELPKAGHWTPEEDHMLSLLVAKYGPLAWSQIAAMMKSRNRKQCRERWVNTLSPQLVKRTWTPQED